MLYVNVWEVFEIRLNGAVYRIEFTVRSNSMDALMLSCLRGLKDFFLWQVDYRNTSVAIDFCKSVKSTAVENDYSRGIVNVYTEAKAPCGADGNYFIFYLFSRWAFQSEEKIDYTDAYLLSLFTFNETTKQQTNLLDPCAISMQRIVCVHADDGAGIINVELRLVCKDTESESFTSDVSTLNPFHFVFRSTALSSLISTVSFSSEHASIKYKR